MPASSKSERAASPPEQQTGNNEGNVELVLYLHPELSITFYILCRNLVMLD